MQTCGMAQEFVSGAWFSLRGSPPKLKGSLRGRPLLEQKGRPRRDAPTELGHYLTDGQFNADPRRL